MVFIRDCTRYSQPRSVVFPEQDTWEWKKATFAKDAVGMVIYTMSWKVMKDWYENQLEAP